VSPASYATPALLEAFFTHKAASRVTVIEAGYPRNDILLSGEGTKVRDRVRAALGIGEGQKAVLYAPTFRDYLSRDGMTAEVGDFLDPLAAAEALGPDCVLLVRGHAFNARGNAERVRGENVRDVTYYHDVMDLCLASDAAILDYSSLRFDYALMRKPMVFLVPDKESYHALRPAIMPYDPTAPGPHVRSTEEAVGALRDLDGVARRYRSAVETLISTYMELEDGHASERVVDAVFGPLHPSTD
jgi:CDP-glycerol glycerophosphotransferase